MTAPAPRRESRPSSGYLALTTALVVMVALVVGAIWQALRAERSNRATAERTLRDYSAVAAWHFAQRANQTLHNLGSPAIEVVDTGNENRSPARLVDPAVLIKRDTLACSAIDSTAQFAFRIDLPSGAITAAGHVPDSSALAELAVKVPPMMRTGGAERHRFVVPTVAGRPMRVAAVLIVNDHDRHVPRAVYGMVFDSGHVARSLARVHHSENLLPPALVGRQILIDRLYIGIESPDGHVLYASGKAQPRAMTATDTIAIEQGHLRVHAAIDPELAPALVIGGLPSSRLPALLSVLALGLLLAGIGLVQLRRERELMRLRSRFVANVSHELRTPLAQISMFGETLMLGRARSQEESTHFAAIIHREARRLTRLVESVLRFSHHEAGGTALRPEPRDLQAELHEAVDDFSPLAGATGCSIELSADPDIIVHADPGALRQIVLNLLENATKYGPRGQRIIVRATELADEALVAVEDQGPGIPRGDRRRALEPFTRLERADQPKVAGTGIGLAVVDELARAHGGRVWIEDAEGGGARVCFTLPLAVAGAEEAEGRLQPQMLPAGD